MSHRRVDGRGRYGKEYGNSLVQRERERERDEPIRREGLQAQGSYKEVPRPSRGLALAAAKRSLTIGMYIYYYHYAFNTLSYKINYL